MGKHESRKNKPILLVGNGINRLFANEPEDDDAFNVEKFRGEKEAEKCSLHAEISESLRFPMRISVLYKGKEETVAEELTDFLKDKMTISKRKKKFLEDLLNLEVENILTTNYSFEFEKTICTNPSIGKILNLYGYGKEGEISKKEKELGIYQYIKLGDRKKLWHIHGIATRKKSIILGQYYYGYLLSQVIGYTSELLRRWNSKNDFYHHSWIDCFVSNDVHILGFALDLAEIDLWWLLAYKKKHFEFTKVYFYSKVGDLDANVRVLLCTYGVIIKEINTADYHDFYNQAITEIRNRIKMDRDFT